jgi:hypothetical protein
MGVVVGSYTRGLVAQALNRTNISMRIARLRSGAVLIFFICKSWLAVLKNGINARV